jgi:hypothetical protein
MLGKRRTEFFIMTQIQGISTYSAQYDLRYEVATRVLIKDSWSDSFSTVEYLDAIDAEAMIAPGIGRATFVYRYGKVLNAPETSYRFLSPKELDGKIVQIETVANTGSGERTLWTGVISTESNQIHGDDLGTESGVQTIAAYEIGSVLDRHTLEGAAFEVSSGVAAVIGNMPDFNRRMRYGLSVLGNRTSAKIGGAYVFSADGAEWTNRDIVEYLLAVHYPPGLTFRITGQSDALDAITETHRLEGMSLFRALDSLVDRHRGLGWNLIHDGDGTVDFNVFTLLDADVSVGDVSIPVNENIIDNIYFASDRVVETTVTYTSDSQYDRVNVIGGKIRSCFTVSIEEGTLEKAWTAAEETAYKTQAASENDEKDAERQTDKHIRVYQYYRIPKDWDGESDTGTPGVHSVALPTVNDDGTIDVTAAANRFLSEKSLSRALPIETDAAITNAEPDYQAPIVALLKGENSKYEQTETAGANVRMADSELAIVISPSINHILGLNHFDASTDGSDTEPVYDYEEIIATIAYDTDERLKVRAKVGNFEDIDEPKTLTISVPDASLWYLVPGTMTGVTNGAIVRDSTGGILRDDSPRLRQIAALTLSWYGVRRAILDISWKRITNPGLLGSLIRNVSDSYQKIVSGTVISTISWNFSSGAQTTSLKTSFADIQFKKLITRKDMDVVRSETLDIEKHIANIPSRFRGGGGTGDTVNKLVWNENTQN